VVGNLAHHRRAGARGILVEAACALDGRGVSRSVLITGAGGYVGHLLVESLATDRSTLESIVATDIRPVPAHGDSVIPVTLDVRDPRLREILAEHEVDTVVHLAAVVTPGKRPDRDALYSVDVGGMENVLECCLDAGVGKVIVSSSGAAYGYHADNPEWIDEKDPLRGNPEFAYSDHKRQVEELLAEWRTRHPEVRQLVFRAGTILGRTTHNQITDLFDRRVVVGIRGAATPFVLVWDLDVVRCVRHGIFSDLTGVFNLAADGTITLREMARRMVKPYLAVPASTLRAVLAVASRIGATAYGPEQVDFLRYRPVLSNRRLKDEFGCVPSKSTSEVFDEFLAGRRGEA
jgi:UDP-glucose 4-epimerase